MTAVEIPTFSECVIGYRVWDVDALGRLRPITASHVVWRPGVNEATCERERLQTAQRMRLLIGAPESAPESVHDAPHPTCGCGLYALHRPSDAFGDLDGFPPDDDITGHLPIYGAVAAFGRLEVHHTGFRAARAGIVALGMPRSAGPRARHRAAEVARSYGVALIDAENLQEEASRYGSPLPDAARPPAPVHHRETMYIGSAGHLYTSSGLRGSMTVRYTGRLVSRAAPPGPSRLQVVRAVAIALVLILLNAAALASVDLGWVEWPLSCVSGVIAGHVASIPGARRNRTAAS